MKEHAALFGATKSLVGIITDPAETAPDKSLPAIVLLNAGLVHRVGPHRLHVTLARFLAAMGFVVLRFDFSGIGDSNVRTDTLPFAQSAIDETQEAMNCLYAARGSKQFVLMGICSGANISLQTACCDPRVVGAVLINPRGHLHGTNDALDRDLRNRALARHYWRIVLRSSFRTKNWGKAITGQIDYRPILKAMLGFRRRKLNASQSKPSSRTYDAMADLRLLAERGARLLHVYSEGDEGLDYFHVVLSTEQIRALYACEKTRIEIMRGVDHTFTLLWSQEALLKVVQQWLQEIWNPAQHDTEQADPSSV